MKIRRLRRTRFRSGYRKNSVLVRSSELSDVNIPLFKTKGREEVKIGLWSFTFLRTATLYFRALSTTSYVHNFHFIIWLPLYGARPTRHPHNHHHHYFSSILEQHLRRCWRSSNQALLNRRFAYHWWAQSGCENISWICRNI